MNQPKKHFLFLVPFLLFSFACVTFMGKPQEQIPQPAAPNSSPNGQELPEETTAPAALCPAVTKQIMTSALAESGEEGGTLEEELYLVTYYVSDNEIYDPYYEDAGKEFTQYQQDEETHQWVWNFFTALIPLEWRGDIGEYSIITDGADGTLAAVTQTMDDPALWGLEVDIADVEDTYSLTFTLIHEFGHLLTLGPSQVPPSLAVFNNPDDEDIYFSELSKCPNYFPGEGCANKNSYINAYFNEFWADIHGEWNQINLEEDEDLYYEKLDEFYSKYEDRFVTDYAATNPEEDIAETWSFFVIEEKPQGNTIANQKILFFYQYPELIALREQIRANFCQLLEE